VADALQQLLSVAQHLALARVNARGEIREWNAGAERLFRLPAAEAIGRSLSPLLHPASDLAVLLSATAPREFELSCLTRNGAVPTRVSLSLADDGDRLLLYTDQRPLYELQRLNEELARSHRETEGVADTEAELLRQMLEHAAQAVQIGFVLLLLPRGEIIWINDGFSRIIGLDLLDMQGSTFEALLTDHPQARGYLAGYVESLRRAATRNLQPPPPANWEVTLPSGRKHIETYGRLFRVDGHPNEYAMLVVENHTDRQRLQMQLVQSEKLAAIGQLAAGIAHEIRNPLATIYSALFDLSEIIVNPSPDAAEDIAISMEEIKRVQEIINNLLDFARESDKSIGSSDLNEVVAKTIRLVQHDLTVKGLETAFELDEQIPMVVLSSNALKQILINLVTNAAHAMGNRGTLTLRTILREGAVSTHFPEAISSDDSGEFHPRQDRPTARRSGVNRTCHVRLEVEDTGSGIPASILPDIFNPFFTTKPPGSGTGLGLSVVHSLVVDGGGAVSVTSTVGVGTTFRIDLPCLTGE
jgi:signal transduction histidine kinase